MRATSAARAEKRRTPRSIRALCGVVRGDATSPCNRTRRPASSAAVSDEAIQIGDRVVHLQVPGVFTVVARRGAFFEVRSEERRVGKECRARGARSHDEKKTTS